MIQGIEKLVNALALGIYVPLVAKTLGAAFMLIANNMAQDSSGIPPKLRKMRDFLVAGGVLFCLGALCEGLYYGSGRLFGQHHWLTGLAPVAGMLKLFYVAGASCYLIAARVALDDDSPVSRTIRRLMVWWVCGIVFVLLIGA